MLLVPLLAKLLDVNHRLGRLARVGFGTRVALAEPALEEAMADGCQLFFKMLDAFQAQVLLSGVERRSRRI